MDQYETSGGTSLNYKARTAGEPGTRFIERPNELVCVISPGMVGYLLVWFQLAVILRDGPFQMVTLRSFLTKMDMAT